ncbi:MAG: 3-hydroxyacyl-CoA dehydrogenase NAD-binding domain-containing protein [Rubritalea sp.]|uniref:3-hydroxyacyl-CoA dehydrogenase NAD-binding domain-containing protein n=1 Tax=Rubritalea sp. TaxID=2109375 RepID=UPI003242C07A
MHLKLETHGTIAHLIFDRKDSSANIFDRDVLAELNQQLDGISKCSKLTALIIRSNKPNIFIAGADLKTLSTASEDELESLIKLGQSVFCKLEDLHITTIAAIHGACVGGGLELALACDYRIASDASCSRIGLPETQLGILPAWGGSTRLPALLGLSKALPLVLSGKIMKVKVALRKGIIDGICPQQHLIHYASSFSSKPKRQLPAHLLEHNPLTVALIRKQAHDSLYKKTRHLYPALNRSVDVICAGVRVSKHESFDNEREAIKELSKSPEASHLINLFFSSERAKKLKIGEQMPCIINHTAVIGSGVMGSGIAYWLSTRKCQVLLKDINSDALAHGMGTIESLYHASVKRHVLSQTAAKSGFDRITASTADLPLNDREIVIEAATEDLELKKKIFAHLTEQVSPNTILATNTSALPIHELAEHITHPERLVGMHFFNPVPRMKLVEVVRAPQTSDSTLAAAVRFIQSIGKLPVVVNDSPGFLVNRILLPYLVRAGQLFSEGHAPETIDNCMVDFGMPMGPLRLLDEVGLDVSLHVAKTLSAAFPDRMEIPSILTDLVTKGLLGKKSNEGFYLYEKGKTKPNPTIQPGASPQSSALKIRDELAYLLSEEASRCLDEGLADSAADIDFAMVMGTGYAPFRGGPLRHAHDTNLLNRTFY